MELPNFANQLLRRAFMCIEDAEWKEANGLLEQVLNQEPENVYGYLGKLFVKLKVKNYTELERQTKAFDTHKEYNRCLEFADEELVNYLQSVNLTVKHKAEKIQKRKRKLWCFLIVLGVLCITCVIFFEFLVLKFAKVGDIVKFGKYDGEKIEWQVLEVDDGQVLLLSKYALKFGKYDSFTLFRKYWENCELREWLNGGFYNKAFSDIEKKVIVSSRVTADRNPKYNIYPGKDTEDKVFLLSISEAERYFPNNDARTCHFYSTYKLSIEENKDINQFIGYYWWLRSPGRYSNYAAYVDHNGEVNDFGEICSTDYFVVRPALRVKIN